MTALLAIDPGDVESGWAFVDVATRRPLAHGKTRNDELVWSLRHSPVGGGLVVIEMIASYGMPVGAEVFDTCVWIGRFTQIVEDRTGLPPQLVFRRAVKLHHCGTSKAKDSNVRQALVDRFARGQANHGKGTKAAPGWFHGFAADVWQAYALAVYAADVVLGEDR